MDDDPLADALAQAERSDAAVRAAALMRIARVQSATAPEEARRNFQAGLEAARHLPSRQNDLLLSDARLVAAVVAPDLLDELPPGRWGPHHFEAERLTRTMIDHGYIDRAADYVLAYQDAATCPFGAIGMLLHRLTGEDRKRKLMDHAVQAWRKVPGEHSQFLWIFQHHWKLLPVEEASALVREIVRLTLDQPEFSSHGTYDPEGTVQIDSGRENTFFQLLHILRRLDPDLAGRLIADHPQLGAAARRFPYGMETVMEESEARRQAAGASCGSGGGGYVMAGSARDMPYLKSLMEAQRSGDFEIPLSHALERYREDTAPDSPNQAPREFWPSTSEFRSILYRAGKRLGVDASSLLDRVPDPDLRLFARIELAAALAGLPELQGIQSEFRPVKERAPEVEDTSGDGPDEPRIRCPKCRWRPGAEDRWSCKCGHIWNTFDTGGVCPQCLYQWKVTQCLRCGEMSPHSDWYTHPR